MHFFRCLLVMTVLVAPAAAAAQEVGFGVKGGINLATFDFDEDPGGDLGLKPGVALGAFVRLPVGERLAIQPEGFFSQKGTDVSNAGVDAWVRLDYLEVPVLVQYAIAKSSTRAFNVFGGPSVAFNLRAESGAEVGGETVDTDIDEDIEDFDFGIVVGAGVDFGRLTLDGRYTFGVSNISTDSGDPKARNRTLAFMAGIRF
jgi:hypothetical protein